ncbi:profilin, required for normal timing of actin polymerization in response to thermal stress [Mortierella sp. NVP85]|nr:profilin, required for normal timing of actin polymerization in response to thermal stress [Mortierella sp. NVP85]
MSWQEYVDKQLIGTGKVVKAGIYGHDGSPWAISKDFKVTVAEVGVLNAAFDNISNIAANGIFIEGEKYLFVRQADVNIIYGRKGTDPIIAVKTGQTIIIGVGDEQRVAGDLNGVVEGLATYLIGCGY